MAISVLLVEDNPGDAMLVIRMLASREGQVAGGGDFQVFHFERLKPAIESFRDRHFDVVLLDMSMPDSHGIETLQRTRAAELRVPIVVLTGTMVEQSMGVEALKQGAQDYLIKDKVDADQLGRTIRYAIERKKIEDELILARETIRQANEDLEKRVRDRTEELFNANQSLENLLYVIAHDLREPVNSIEFLTKRMISEEKAIGREQSEEIEKRIARAANRMRKLLDDVLSLSRVMNVETEGDSINARELVDSALEMLEEKIRASGAHIRISPSLPDLRVNRDWATQAIRNLLENAIKFTRPGVEPEIDVCAYDGGSAFSEMKGIVIRDRGPGVPEECAESIFELFRRAVGREVEGTGAGLAIVNAVAKKHGGRAWVRAREGGGSDFVIAFRTKIFEPVHR